MIRKIYLDIINKIKKLPTILVRITTAHSLLVCHPAPVNQLLVNQSLASARYVAQIKKGVARQKRDASKELNWYVAIDVLLSFYTSIYDFT